MRNEGKREKRMRKGKGKRERKKILHKSEREKRKGNEERKESSGA